MKDLYYEKGTLIGFECGEYSDFGFLGMLVCLQDIDLPDLVRTYRDGVNPDRKQYNDDVSGFLAWLVAGGLAAPIDYSTVHLGAYDTFYSSVIGKEHKSTKVWE